MGRTKGSSGETTKPRIQTAAARLFAEAGYDAVTMRGIGAAVGLRAGALYRYFPDKESLAAELLKDAVEARDRALGTAAGGEPLPRLEGFVDAYTRWHMGSGGGASLIALVSDALGTDSRAALETRLEEILAAGEQAGAVKLPDRRVAARAILALLDEVAGDARLPEDRRARIAWRFVSRLVGA
ncbi:MAG: TetR/AcrR family transcriptional regulator [Paracoccaceae bacterium]|nr:TetR/AcrR family transcriptional regulator [Paracoccaceae bacterium]